MEADGKIFKAYATAFAELSRFAPHLRSPFGQKGLDLSVDRADAGVCQ